MPVICLQGAGDLDANLVANIFCGVFNNNHRPVTQESDRLVRVISGSLQANSHKLSCSIEPASGSCDRAAIFTQILS